MVYIQQDTITTQMFRNGKKLASVGRFIKKQGTHETKVEALTWRIEIEILLLVWKLNRFCNSRTTPSLPRYERE